MLVGPGWFPDVATDLTGRVHIVWSSGVGNYDTVMYMTSPDGQQWSDVLDIAARLVTAGDYATRPAIFVDSTNIFHLTYRTSTVYYSFAPAESVSAATLSSPLVMNSSQIPYYSHVARDSKGILHLIYTENVPYPNCSICFHVFYRKSSDNGLNWTPAVDISYELAAAAKPQLLIDWQDNLHLVLETGRRAEAGTDDPAKAAYLVSYDSGTTWTTPITFELPPLTPTPTPRFVPTPEIDEEPELQQRNVAIGLDGQGNLIVVWWGLPQDQLFFQLSNDQGRSWSSPQLIPKIWGAWFVFSSHLDDYAMATDSAGNIHLVAVGRAGPTEKRLRVMHLVWDGANWSEPEFIATYAGDAPEWPRIAISNGNQLHVVWYVRNKEAIWDSENGDYWVWYAQGVSSAPALTPVVWPTLTPTATLASPTASPPTPTPQATVTADFVGEIGTGVYSESAILVVVAKAVIPAAIMVSVAATAVLLWRRWH